MLRVVHNGIEYSVKKEIIGYSVRFFDLFIINRPIDLRDEFSDDDFSDLVAFLNDRCIRGNENLLNMLKSYDFGQPMIDTYTSILRSCELDYTIIRNGKKYNINYYVFATNSDLLRKQDFSKYGMCF